MSGFFPGRFFVIFLFVTVTIATESFRHERSYILDRQIQSELLIQFWNCMQKSQHDPYDENTEHCPSTSEDWFCWESTVAGETAVLPCPVRNRVKDNGYVTRRCLANGTWDVDPLTGKEKITFVSCPVHHLHKSFESLEAIFNDLRQLETLALASSAAFEECVDGTLTAPRRHHGESEVCPRTFDGWGCWNDTSAGIVAYIPCPTFITGFSPNKFAYRKCNSDGTWFRHPDTNRTWSNYTTCVDTEDLQFRQQINNLYIVGYFLSVVALTVSFLLFCYFKQLNCTRIIIHKNLFVSFIINNVMWIIWYSEVVQKPEVPLNNGLPCQVLHVVVHYFMVSNYLWMFCEGLYLHILMVVAFVKEDRILRWFYLLGWGLPGVLITIYTSVRGTQHDKTTFCWLEESVFQWILSGPVIVSMLINFIFLINIVHVLVTKLRAPNSQDTHQTRKAVRATLILIPLLGLHYVVTPFRPEPKTVGEAVYEITSAVVTSFQGLCVSLLFCFFNGEIISLVKKRFNCPSKETERSKHYCANTTVCCEMQEVTAV